MTMKLIRVYHTRHARGSNHMRESSRAATDSISAEFSRIASSMPVESRRLLVERVDPESITPAQLLSALGRTSPTQMSMAWEAPVLQVGGLLSAKACKALRAAVDGQRSVANDSVDGGPEHQLNLSREALELLIGRAECTRLWEMPGHFRLQTAVVPVLDGTSDGALSSSMNRTTGERHAGELESEGISQLRECFVRRYSTDSRPWIPFHTDAYEVTVNVALCEDDSHTGGQLLGVHGGKIQAIHRGEGDATVHSSKLLHAVSAMTSGVRYTLIAFFDRKGTAKGRWAEDKMSGRLSTV